MAKYLIQRVLSLLPVLLVVAVVVFLLIHLTPGDPASVILGDEASAESVAVLREQLGLNLPLHQQFLAWFGNVLRGDLGDSIFMDMSVAEAFFSRVPPTLSLAILAQIIAVVLALYMGIVAARKRGTLADQAVMGVSLLGISVPSFLLGLFLILIFAVEFKWLPVAGYRPLSNGLWDHLRYLLLPAIALGAMQAALIARMTRSSLIEVLSEQYIKTARAKGLQEKKIVYKHALKNAFIPILTVIGETFGTLITGAAVIETVFNIPGIGQLIINSIERRDFAVIQGSILLITITYVLLNLLIDLLYGLLDPRIKLNRR
ncbi:ABC transporter permease [Paenibacillus jiagnxiensis]|uniref:ABC transporter permease n=1 Tax=Paenibacillus jiagnxiensis TaxID=3228926 RepID=UPI0033AB64F2